MSVIEKNNHRGNKLDENLEISRERIVSPEDVLQLTSYCDSYLCSPNANIYEIDFTRFKIRDLESGNVLFEIAKPPYVEGTTEKVDLGSASEETGNRGASIFLIYCIYMFTCYFRTIHKISVYSSISKVKNSWYG